MAERPRPIEPRAEQPKEAGEGEKPRIALVDGANAAYSVKADGASLGNLLLIRDAVAEDGLDPIIIADAALRHAIDDRTRYEAMVTSGEIRQAPAGTDADYFLLAFARELDARIVSNDRFGDRASGFPDAQERIIRFMIVKGEVVLERRADPRRKE